MGESFNVLLASVGKIRGWARIIFGSSHLCKNQYHFKNEVLLLHVWSNRVHRTKGWEDVPYDFLSLAFNILQQSF